MVKLHPGEKHLIPQVGLSIEEKQNLPVVKIRYVHTPDAYIRLSRALDILLNSATAREAALEESINPDKKQAPPEESGDTSKVN